MSIAVLGRNDLTKILQMPRVIEGVESVYRLKAKGSTVVWPLVAYDFKEYDAVMDIRSGCVFGENIHGLKMLNNFPHNKDKGLPSFNGILLIFDSTTGIPLGVMDAAYITCMRTGAAGAIGAKALARPDSKTLFVLGAGKQSIFQIAATLSLMKQIEKVYIADPLDKLNAVEFANNCPKMLSDDFDMTCQNVKFEAVDDIAGCIAKSDIVITITPARSPVIKKEWVREGTHFSCIGADMEGKEEIDPELFKNARVYADDIDQCIRVGEMEIPIRMDILKKEDIIGEIGQLLDGKVKGRLTDKDITIFDATGLALLDLVTGKKAIEESMESSLGIKVEI